MSGNKSKCILEADAIALIAERSPSKVRRSEVSASLTAGLDAAPRSSARSRNNPQQRTQAHAANVIDRNIARGDAGWSVRYDDECVTPSAARVALHRKRLGAIRSLTDRKRAARLEAVLLAPGDFSSVERRKLVRFLKLSNVLQD